MEIIEREIFSDLKSQLDDRKVSLIIGPRQVGKTTLLKELFSLVNDDVSLFLDLDIFSNYEKVSDYKSFINTLKLNGYKEDGKKFYVFLDEFQRYDDFSMVLKNVYDHHINIKVFASGSSSILIKDSIQESLAGRKRLNYLYPFSFLEFLRTKDRKFLKIYNNINSISGDGLNNELNDLYELLYEFMIFGGYPEVVLSSSSDEKIKCLESIFDLYLKKDIINYIEPSNVSIIKKLVEFLAVNNGGKLKYNNVSNRLNINYKITKKYVEILKESYFIFNLRPFFTNKNKEITKTQKCYFLDTGVRNYFVNNFNELSIRNDTGELFETFIINEFIKRGYSNLKYWEDKNQNEVDLIVDLVSRQIPFEIKFKDRLRKSDFNSLEKFISKYADFGYLINKSEQDLNPNIKRILPFYDFGSNLFTN